MCGPFIREDGSKGYSVAWVLWKKPSQVVDGVDIDIEPFVCSKCGFIFQGIIT